MLIGLLYVVVEEAAQSVRRGEALMSLLLGKRDDEINITDTAVMQRMARDSFPIREDIFIEKPQDPEILKHSN